MIPVAFDYARAESADHALDLLRDAGPDAKLLAGGHSLLPLLKLRFADVPLLVDISRVRDLSYIRADGDEIAIGACTRHHDVERDPTLRQRCGLVADVAGKVGDPQVRHRGTIGGSVAHADPAGDLPTALLALDARFVVAGSDGERTVPAADFFTGAFQTAVRPGELLTEIRVPSLDGRGWAYEKFRRRAMDWAIVGVAAIVDRANGQLRNVQVGLTGMGLKPLRANAVEQALTGAEVSAIDEAANAAAEGTHPPGDVNGSPEYRQHLARVLTGRALRQAAGNPL